MFAKWIILTLGAGVFAACSDDRPKGKDLELLTGSPWKYQKAGFDDDDGSFNALDPHIAGNEKDNTIIFCKDGTGYSEASHPHRSHRSSTPQRNFRQQHSIYPCRQSKPGMPRRQVVGSLITKLRRTDGSFSLSFELLP